MTRQNASAHDLALAVAWLRTYDDSHDGGEGTAACARAADYLDAEIYRRAQNAKVRAVAKGAGATITQARAFLKRKGL